MKLQSIEIKNYRSIQDLTFDFGAPQALILVGINESGKSNILKAMNLLSKDETPAKKDIRIARPSDAPVKESHVRFKFSLTDAEVADLTKNIKQSFHAKDPNAPIAVWNEASVTVDEFISKRREGVHIANLMTQAKNTKYYAAPSGVEIVEGWGFAGTSTPSGVQLIIDGESNPKSVLPESLVHLPSVVGDIPDWIQPLTLNQLNEKIGKAVVEAIKVSLSQAMFWNYQPENLLPNEISINDFSNNPDSCKPLRYMFELAEENDIGAAIKEARAVSIHNFKALLGRVSSAATKYLREVWKDHKDVSIKLEPNGELITISIIDSETSFSFEQRSDGFKRFVTFLLLVAVRVKTNAISNMLLLFDEPEISLHPSGIRNLRDEMFKMAESNYVVIATHSPFMIDKNDFDRNQIISKKNEVTVNQKIEDDSEMYEEEVLLSALGTSVFEVIKSKNLVLEGWRDKKLIEVFRTSKRKDAEYAALQELGLCHAQGVKDIKNLVPFFQVCGREVLILTDADQAAIQWKNEHEKNHSHGTWFTFEDIIQDGPKPVTAEDFITKKTLANAAKIASGKVGVAVTVLEADFPEVGRSDFMKAKASPQLAEKTALNTWMHEWKSAIFENLKFNQIEPTFAIIAKFVNDAM